MSILKFDGTLPAPTIKPVIAGYSITAPGGFSEDAYNVSDEGDDDADRKRKERLKKRAKEFAKYAKKLAKQDEKIKKVLA